MLQVIIIKNYIEKFKSLHSVYIELCVKICLYMQIKMQNLLNNNSLNLIKIVADINF